MGEIVRLKCITTLPIPPDDVLQDAKGQLDYVLVLGWTKDGEMYAAASESAMERTVYIASEFIHKVHAGDFD